MSEAQDAPALGLRHPASGLRRLANGWLFAFYESAFLALSLDRGSWAGSRRSFAGWVVEAVRCPVVVGPTQGPTRRAANDLRKQIRAVYIAVPPDQLWSNPARFGRNRPNLYQSQPPNSSRASPISAQIWLRTGQVCPIQGRDRPNCAECLPKFHQLWRDFGLCSHIGPNLGRVRHVLARVRATFV